MERYRVLGRTAYPEPLEHHGTVEGADDRAPAAAALDPVGGRGGGRGRVPARAVHWVIGGD